LVESLFNNGVLAVGRDNLSYHQDDNEDDSTNNNDRRSAH
jgi:hypothetical protein